MFFMCNLCEKETVYLSKFCEKCRKVKHYLNLYDDRVYEILDSVLSRDPEKQNNKIRMEINKEIETMRAKQIKRGTDLN